MDVVWSAVVACLAKIKCLTNELLHISGFTITNIISFLDHVVSGKLEIRTYLKLHKMENI